MYFYVYTYKAARTSQLLKKNGANYQKGHNIVDKDHRLTYAIIKQKICTHRR